MYKNLLVIALFGATIAAPADHHQATSFSSFNDNHNSVHHIDSASSPVKYGAPTRTYYAQAEKKETFPSENKLTIPAFTSYYQNPAQQYSSSSHHTYAAPSSHSLVFPAKVAVPFTKIAPVAYTAPITKYVAAPSHTSHHEEFEPAKYEFAYSVEDAHTGDIHSQQEQRDGDHVVGQYSLHESDGTIRLVKYSDEGHGFNAIVERQGHPTDAPVYKKAVSVEIPQYAHFH